MAKRFFYTSKDYMGRVFTETYTRAGRWSRINYNTNGQPYFRHNGRRYYLDNFLRCGLSGLASEITAADGEAVSLAGCEADSYYKPLFVEIDDGGEAVRVYRFEGTNTEC